MLRRTTTFFASKTTGTSATYQARPPRRKPKQFNCYIGAPVSTKEIIREQRASYGGVYFTRRPLYYPGSNTWMNPKTLAIRATAPGVVTVRESFLSPSTHKWIDIDPDIQKVATTNRAHKAFRKRGLASYLTSRCKSYREELLDVARPQWREEALRKKTDVEHFVDPNLFARGVVPKLTPLDKFVTM